MHEKTDTYIFFDAVLAWIKETACLFSASVAEIAYHFENRAGGGGKRKSLPTVHLFPDPVSAGSMTPFSGRVNFSIEGLNRPAIGQVYPAEEPCLLSRADMQLKQRKFLSAEGKSQNIIL